MRLKKITREEFDRRLEQSTERMRQERIALEEQVADLQKRIREAEATLQLLERRSPTEGGEQTLAGNNRWVHAVAGQFRDDPHYAEAYRLGREWREEQVPEYPVDVPSID